jgi:ATP/maltotriose-dependent transcriptional regulator MalT/DNA-binding MarR family transcriptional regulator
MAAKPHLTVTEKILIHLLDKVKFEDRFEVPYTLTQGGIADAVSVRRSYVSSATKEMINKGLLSEKLSHIKGEARRRKSYFLTPEGKAAAEKLRNDVSTQKVLLRDEEGESELDIGDIKKKTEIKLSFLEIIARISEEGALDLTAAQAPAAETGIDVPQSYPQPRYFFGRDKEMSEIASFLDSSEARFLAIKGIAGIGKTTLVAKVAQDGKKTRKIFWYRFHDWSTLRNVLSHLSDFLNKTGRESLRLYLEENTVVDLGDVQALLRNQLSGLAALFIIDDFHRANESCVQLFEALLDVADDAPKIKIILTGRTVPRFYDRRDVLVKKRVCELELSGLDMESSRQLLLERDIDETKLDEIYEETQGHPLCLELVELSDEGVGKRNIEQYLTEEVEGRLSEKQKAVLRFASVFRYPVPREAYLLVPYEEGDITHETIDELVERTLITTSDSYYDIHELIRDFFFFRMSPKQKTAYHSTVAEYFMDVAGDLAQIEATFHLVSAGDGEQAVSLALANGEHLINRGYLEEFYEVLRSISKPDISSGDLSKLLVMEADIATTQGRWDEALRLYERSLEAAQEAGDSRQVAMAHYKIAAIHYRRGALDKALELNNRSRELLVDANEPKELAKLYNNIGVIFWKKGDFDEAKKNYESSLWIAQDIGDERGVARAQNNLGIIHWENKKNDEALEYFLQSLKISEKLEDLKTMAQLYDNLGEAYFTKGEKDKALELYEKSLSLSEKLGFRWQIAEVFRNLGKVYEGDKGKEFLEKALDLFEALGAKKDALELKERLSGL